MPSLGTETVAFATLAERRRSFASILSKDGLLTATADRSTLRLFARPDGVRLGDVAREEPAVTVKDSSRSFGENGLGTGVPAMLRYRTDVAIGLRKAADLRALATADSSRVRSCSLIDSRAAVARSKP